ncbi:MAG TPA: ThuA domain-containing protein [Candidatus Hydrogenedentes bacterium]|nr:ThuA domain-containing protein [Candidatus Hydrogenedentota bacterium]HQH53595.1 ThuA domain-containing protein [Candidatus Hydrogenedentota bacterium]HQM49888.1 ThuA domain-containing protein [Candidatus Hydrogenedentota bacterium]
MAARNAFVAALVVLGCSLSFAGESPAPKNVLFLVTSEAFAHGPTVAQGDKPCLAEQVLRPLLDAMGAKLTVTYDASTINAENLKNYDIVMFYTQGDLTKPNKTGTPVMGPNGQAELIQWLENGGRFLGFHSATDTFRGEGEDVTPYIAMIGAEFMGHGKQFVGKVKAVDPNHPVMAHIPDGLELNEEWYCFRKFNEDAIHVLALMDPGPERAKQEMYNIEPYPVVWVRTIEKGRVYFTALGHREDVWESERFKQSIVDAVHWLMSTDDPQAQPNYKQAVPAAKSAETPGH